MKRLEKSLRHKGAALEVKIYSFLQVEIIRKLAKQNPYSCVEIFKY
jgi:hypothetical protein